MTTCDNYQAVLLALCIWREARGESLAARNGVGCVIRNRCAIAPAEGFKADMIGNILKPWAFSSFNTSDPNAGKFPLPDDPSWIDSCAAADAVLSGCPDATNGAQFYFSPPVVAPPHVWGPVKPSARIGHLSFYKIA